MTPDVTVCFLRVSRMANLWQELLVTMNYTNIQQTIHGKCISFLNDSHILIFNRLFLLSGQRMVLRTVFRSNSPLTRSQTWISSHKLHTLILQYNQMLMTVIKMKKSKAENVVLFESLTFIKSWSFDCSLWASCTINLAISLCILPIWKLSTKQNYRIMLTHFWPLIYAL